MGKYAYQNTSLVAIKGERWKDIPGLEGYYKVSNLGRVKRLQYEMIYRNGAVYTKEEMIIKPSITRFISQYRGDISDALAIRMTLDGIRYNFMVARLVYYCFVKRFDLKDQQVIILTKNYDNLHVVPSNLVMADRRKRQQRIVERGHFRSPLLDLSPVQRQRIRNAIVKAKSKRVTQYSMAGKKMRTFPSMAEAERATGVFASSIGQVAGMKGVSAGGFLWRWGSGRSVDMQTIREAREEMLRKNRIDHGTRVTQYDMDGNKIASYPSLTDAQMATGIGSTLISGVLRGIYKSAKGFYWKEGTGKDKIDLTNHQWGRRSMAISQSKPVKQYSLAGKYLRSYPSRQAAAKAVNVKPASITDVCTGRSKTCAGFLWKSA